MASNCTDKYMEYQVNWYNLLFQGGTVGCTHSITFYSKTASIFSNNQVISVLCFVAVFWPL
jgi:hypothetical protein